MRFCFLALLIASLPFSTSTAQERPAYFEPIAFYDLIKDRLTPIEDVTAGIEIYKDSGKSGIVLLNERIEYIVTDTERYRVDHSIYYVAEKSGVDPIGKDTFRYRKQQETVHLVLAHAIQPDGKVTPVSENAVFIQSPQEEADSNLYTDYDELVVIYPDIDVGSITEHIVITKEFEPIVPNQIAHSFYFQFNWPIYRTHYEIDVPDSYAQRFNTARIGTGIPTPTQSSADGRTRWQYLDTKKAGRVWEANREPSSDIGPVERITTFSSWDEVADWIRTLVNERNKLSDDLKQEIDSWTAGITDRSELIQAILDPIANDVRYTGLEFGLAGYQPYDCNSVWENKYGDCKDKANLLAAALNYKGITAHIVLIDTDSLGKFDKSFPSPFHFNHAITVVENEDGSRLFLDPTVENLKIGDLPNGDVNRDVLVILDDRADIGKTPLVSAGQLRFEFDLNLSSDLTVSGWYHMYANGYYGSWYKTFFQEKNQEGLRWNMHERIEGYFPGAETADATFNPDHDENTPIASAYFVLKNESNHDASNYTFALPDISWVLPSPGDTAEGRSTEFNIDKSDTTILVKINTPGSVRANSLPKDLNLSTPDYQYTGQWWQEENRINAKISISHKTDRIAPKSFSEFHSTIGSVNRWWKTPATFSTVEALQAAENKAEDPFPKLSSAVAQIALAEDLYDRDDQPEKRRAAFQKVIEWFPEARAEIYEASMEIVRLDIDVVEPETLAKRIAYLVHEYANDITPEYLSWGEYLLAQEYDKADNEAEALKLFLSHIENDELSAYRHGWSAYNAAWILKDKNPKEFLRVVKIGIQAESTALKDLTYLLVSHLVKAADSKQLEAELKQLEKTHPQTFVEIIEYVSDELEDNRFVTTSKGLATWSKSLQRICQEHPQLSENLTALKRIESSLELEKELVAAGKSIEQLLKKRKPAWYTKNLPRKKISQDQLDELIRGTENTEEWNKQAAWSAAYFIRFPEDLNLASKYFYWTVWNLTHHLEEPEIQEAFNAALLKLTPANHHIVNANIDLAKAYRESGEFEKAAQLFEHLLDFQALAPSSRSIAHTRYAETLESMGQNKKAIEHFLVGGKEHFSNYRVYEGLLRCFFLAQIEGDNNSALQALAYLAEGDSEDLESAGVLEQTRRVLAMNQNPAFRDEYWKRAREVISEAFDVAEDLGIPSSNLPDRLPVIFDYPKIAETVANANNSRDTETYHRHLILLALAAATNQDDLKEALTLISANIADDVATQRLFSSLAKLAEFAAYEGSYLNADQLKRFVVHAHLAAKDESALQSWTHKIIADGKTSEGTIDFAILMWSSLNAMNGLKEHKSFDALQERIATSEITGMRAKAVNLMVALLYETNRFEEARELLETELKKPVIFSNKEIAKKLNNVLAEIYKADITHQAFTKKVQAFRANSQMDWWDHIHPLNTEELYSDGIRIDLIDTIFGSYTYVEMAKHYFLLAENEDEEIDARQDAFVEGIRYWQYINADPHFVCQRIRTLTEDETLDQSMRNSIKVAQTYYLTNILHVQELEQLLSDDSFLSEFYRQDLNDQLAYLKMPTDSYEESLAAIRFLMAGPFTQDDRNFLKKAVTNIVVRFGPEAADPILEELKDVSIATGEDFDTAALRLDGLQTKRIAAKVEPFFREITQFVDTDPPESYPFLASTNSTSIESLPALMALQVKRFGYSFDMYEYLGDIVFYSNSIQKTDNTQSIAKLYEFLQQTDSSFITLSLIYSISTGIDQDEISQLTPFIDALRTFALEKQDAMVADVHNAYLMHHQTKLDEATRKDADAFIYPTGASRKYESMHSLILAQQSNNRSKATSLLQSMDSELLYDPELNMQFYTIARDLGDELLAELLEEKLDEQIHDQLSWCISNQNWNAMSLLPYLVAFPEKAEKVSWYFDFVIGQTKNQLSLAQTKTMQAFAKSDWQAVLDRAADADAIVPTFWDLLLPKGIALYHLGDHQNAKLALQKYIHYRPLDALRSTADTYIERIDTEYATLQKQAEQQPIQ